MTAKPRHSTIPIFMPEMACPFRCIYCNQAVITASSQQLSEAAVRDTIEHYLATQRDGNRVMVGFFGGTFTGLPLAEQERLLRIVNDYVERGQIEGVTLSTRPDYIDAQRVELLRRYSVRNVELGVQSLDDEVLRLTRRGYTSQQVYAAAELIQRGGMEVGMQMMIGLPGDTSDKALATAQRIVAAGSTNTRIYPTLVVKGTALETLWRRGEYQPQTLDEAVQWTKRLLPVFAAGGVRVLRVGLHPTEGFISGNDYLAGPFHVSFRELVESAMAHDILVASAATLQTGCRGVEVVTAQESVNAAVGYGGSNRQWLESRYGKVRYTTDDSMTAGSIVLRPLPTTIRKQRQP